MWQHVYIMPRPRQSQKTPWGFEDNKHRVRAAQGHRCITANIDACSVITADLSWLIVLQSVLMWSPGVTILVLELAVSRVWSRVIDIGAYFHRLVYCIWNMKIRRRYCIWCMCTIFVYCTRRYHWYHVPVFTKLIIPCSSFQSSRCVWL